MKGERGQRREETTLVVMHANVIPPGEEYDVLTRLYLSSRQHSLALACLTTLNLLIRTGVSPFFCSLLKSF